MYLQSEKDNMCLPLNEFSFKISIIFVFLLSFFICRYLFCGNKKEINTNGVTSREITTNNKLNDDAINKSLPMFDQATVEFFN
jgi:hypothetical protein